MILVKITRDLSINAIFREFSFNYNSVLKYSMSVPFSFIHLRPQFPPIRSVRRVAEYPFSHAGEAEGVAIITFNLILAHVVLAAQKKESNTLCLRRVIKLADIKGGEVLIKEINHLAKASKASIPCCCPNVFSALCHAHRGLFRTHFLSQNTHSLALCWEFLIRRF